MEVKKLIRKVGRGIGRRYSSWVGRRADHLGARWGRASRLVRWPLPWTAPHRRAELHVIRKAALGDVLLCTPALRELKRRNPDCRITLYTDFRDLVEGLPFIDRVLPSGEESGGAVWLGYEGSLPPRRHLARIIGDRLGLDVGDVRPACAVRRDLVERNRSDWSGLPRPVVVITRRASVWTPNKDWPDELWCRLIERLASRGTVVEVGAGPEGEPTRPGGNYLDLRGRTTLAELVGTIAAADLHVAPITGTVHIAAAVGVPSVVIYGGYEHPVGTDYAGNINLYSPVECAPCWLRDPCPYGKKCLHMIDPDRVEAAVDRLWADARRLAATDRASAPVPVDGPGHRARGECRGDPIEIGTDLDDR